MFRNVKPRNARSKRALEKREPKIHESGRTILFLKASSTSQIIQTALLDLYSLKKPNAIHFSKKNKIYPFEDTSSLEFLSKKNDASFIVIGTHVKKRPNTLVFVRMFDYQVLDMLELSIENSMPMMEFKNEKCSLGLKPMLLFSGTLFESSAKYRLCKSMFLDFFHNQQTERLDVEGLQYAICFLTQEPTDKEPFPPIFFRVYMVKNIKTGKVELEEMGPRYDFFIQRIHEADEKMMKEAMKKPKKQEPKIKKNIDIDKMGNKIGQIHLVKQNIDQLQTRKFKGLKRKDINDIKDESLDENRKKHRRVTFENEPILYES